ncbi:type IV secretory system conjugative DNA transfer family protein [Nocardia arthritidis]|nr:type IV secretory system conjugative DNA transfer family protein [Nocardia arthritidis]
MTEIRRRRPGGQTGTSLGADAFAWAALICAAMILASWAALAIGQWAAGLPITVNPVHRALSGDPVEWPRESTMVLLALAAVLAAVGSAAAWRKWSSRTGCGVDIAARTMQSPRELIGVDKTSGPEVHDGSNRGMLLGYTISGHRPVYLVWEMVCTVIAGTRTGKSAAYAIRAILDAPGPCIATSNKADVWAHTDLPRRSNGARTWLADPQGVTGAERIEFWWNPLAHVSQLRHARRLASFFVAASTPIDSRVDSYFDGGAKELLALYMLASAIAGGDLVHVLEWLGNPLDETADRILQSAGKLRAAARIGEARDLHPRQRDGLLDMARRFLDVLSDDDYARMALPPRRRRFVLTGGRDIRTEPGTYIHNLPVFDPVQFVTSRDTLYALSMEGADSAAALTTALVGQVLDAAVAESTKHGGRLLIPLIAVLDEVANICKLPELPSQYSHFGGRGIIPLTFLQSRKQGERVWGPGPMAEMLDQSVQIYGGNVADTEYLGDLSKLIGGHDVSTLTESIAAGPRGRSRSLSWRTEEILTVDDLAALPKQRAIIRFPHHKPILVNKIWWWDSEHRAAINDSLISHGIEPFGAKRPALKGIDPVEQSEYRSAPDWREAPE